MTPYSHMAEHVRSKGRGADTMLIHMTPHEVGGLQALAMAHGGSLTINPDTGLPEAGWLGKLLPTILGGLGMAFGIPPIWMGALGAVGGTAITGNLKEGLMAGLGAFGGASMAGGLGLGGAISKNALGLVGTSVNPVVSGVAAAPGFSAASRLAPIINSAGATTPLVGAVSGLPGTVGAAGAAGAASAAAPVVAQQIAPTVAKTGLGGIMQDFGSAARTGLGTGILSKAAVPLAMTGALGGISNALTPTYKPGKDKKEPDEYGYTGPYQMHREVLNPYDAANTPFNPASFDSSERLYFGPTSYTDASGKEWTPGQKTTPTAANASSFMANPVTITPEERMRLFGYADGGQVNTDPYAFPIQSVPHPAQQMTDGSYAMQSPAQPQSSPYMQQSAYGQPSPQANNPNDPNSASSIKGLPGLRRGGEVPLKNGSFIVDARTVSELGNGSSGAGQDLLARLGGMPIRGPGDGVSDSIQASIGGSQQARVARDEVHFSPEAVQRLGRGSQQRGTQKLYALMNKAQTARKKAKRGQDTGLRRGIA